jgi:uncharacterized membrane-anchored protein YhcB (DUF1043 family)
MFLKYTHPANMGFDLVKLYTYDELKSDFNLSDEVIKIVFTPYQSSWDNVSETSVNLVKEDEAE